LRERSAVIPPGEELYRTVQVDWVDGDRVLAVAIDGQGTSCARSAFATAQETVAAAVINRPVENGAVSITPAKLPTDFLACNGVRYDVFAYDDPVPENESHCEIRWRRVSDRPTTEHFRMKGAARDELKAAIADQMTVLIQPKTVSESA
jgi:hypothetical protein